MAFPLSNSFEGGSDETTLTTGNTGGASGDAFDTFFIGAGNALVFDTARAAHGSLSARVENVVADAVRMNWDAASTGGGFTETWGRFYAWFPTGLTGGQRLVTFNLTAGTRQAHLEITSSPNFKLRVADNLFASNDTVASIPFDQWVRIEWHVLHSATVGLLEGKIFSADSLTPITNGTVTSPASRNTGASADKIQLGQSAGGLGGTFWMDDIQANVTGFPGPYVEPGGEPGLTYHRRSRATSW